MENQPQTTTPPAQPIERVFDETGQTIEEVVATEAPAAPSPDSGNSQAPGTPAAAKFRIGDREFATQGEALSYAQSQVEVADAYRQGLQDASASVGQPQGNVTPTVTQAPALNTEELYTKPEEFLRKYAQQIKQETRAELDHRDGLKAQSDRIWNDFTHRHPDLADFRGEVETFVERNQPTVRGLVSTKGMPASFDFIATKLKAQFEGYANALKPKRELPNTTTGASPARSAESVTPKADVKKPLSFAEQIRTLRKKR